jgi:hypothetical protein
MHQTLQNLIENISSAFKNSRLYAAALMARCRSKSGPHSIVDFWLPSQQTLCLWGYRIVLPIHMHGPHRLMLFWY